MSERVGTDRIGLPMQACRARRSGELLLLIIVRSEITGALISADGGFSSD
jgi:hypothetical protein